MKKFILISLLLNLSILPMLAAPQPTNKDMLSADITENAIKDELIESDNFKGVFPKYAKNQDIIEDEIIENFKQEKSMLKLWTTKNDVIENSIEDELVNSEYVNSSKGKWHHKHLNIKQLEDDFANSLIDKTKVAKVLPKTKYDFTQKHVAIKLRISQSINTKLGLREGEVLSFKTLGDHIVDGRKIPKGSEVLGRVETVSASDKMGVPESVVIDNFYLKDCPSINFYGYVSKTGANRSLWVYPLYQAGNIALYVAGFVFVPIHGGRVKFRQDDIYTVYYEPGTSN